MTSINNLDVDYFEVEQIALMSPMGTDVVEQHKRVFGLVIDFGTSQSPKSTQPLTTYLCPSPVSYTHLTLPTSDGV